jgi:hypothetical protein
MKRSSTMPSVPDRRALPRRDAAQWSDSYLLASSRSRLRQTQHKEASCHNRRQGSPKRGRQTMPKSTLIAFSSTRVIGISESFLKTGLRGLAALPTLGLARAALKRLSTTPLRLGRTGHQDRTAGGGTAVPTGASAERDTTSAENAALDASAQHRDILSALETPPRKTTVAMAPRVVDRIPNGHART